MALSLDPSQSCSHTRLEGVLALDSSCVGRFLGLGNKVSEKRVRAVIVGGGSHLLSLDNFFEP